MSMLSSEQAVSTIILRCVHLSSTNLLESEFLRTHSLGGKDMKAITKQALEVIEYIKRYVHHTFICRDEKLTIAQPRLRSPILK